MTTSATEWINQYAKRLGIDAPSAEEVELLLDLARLAAHASERSAAPISCWLAARSGSSPEQARVAAAALAEAPPQ